ncbi:uncharacterized protein LOC103514831 [Diaphorina citri]|uniref:Uncharacterized protein LOC103514831 n=1 Tax=Diaphorina citri TaxID=121845 RepID=A0A3Q0J4S7_DIACI|nr:uncharacterized protein LOC103514831 [Diaphorina citri]
MEYMEPIPELIYPYPWENMARCSKQSHDVTTSLILHSDSDNAIHDVTTSLILHSDSDNAMLSSDTSGVGGGLLQRAASSGGGIAARLAALQHNGQSAWRKRVQKDEVVKISATSSINQAQDLIRSQLTCPVPPSVPVSEALGQLPPESRLAARLGQLETASQGWKRRVGVSDARQFSVAGRMCLDSEEEKTSPLSSLTLGGVTLNGGPGERQRRTPRPERFKCKSATNIPRTLGEEEHSALTRSTSLSSDTPHPSPLLNGGVTTVGEVNGGGAKGGETGTNVGEIANENEATKRGEVGINGNETTNGGEINGGDLTTNGSKAGEVRPNHRYFTTSVHITPFQSAFCAINFTGNATTGTHLGRGVNFFHEELRKLNEIRTLDLRVWHIEEFESSVLPEARAHQEGHKPGEILLVQRELAKLSRSTYPPSQLLQRPLPEGVDPTKLELYLSPEHFLEILGMPREEFVELPVWKQCKMKQAAGLF